MLEQAVQGPSIYYMIQIHKTPGDGDTIHLLPVIHNIQIVPYQTLIKLSKSCHYDCDYDYGTALTWKYDLSLAQKYHQTKATNLLIYFTNPDIRSVKIIPQLNVSHCKERACARG